MHPLIRLLRPHQWVKNGFVFVGLLFGHAWDDARMPLLAAIAFAAFCLLSSAVYVMNDIVDREQDRLHPEKKLRPLASGAVGIEAAIALGAACLAGGLALAVAGGGALAAILGAYLLLNLAYSHGLKHVVVLDVFLIAAGFMLRLLAGTVGIGIEPSRWLLLCGLMLTLFLGFAKRRAELNALMAESGGHRRVLDHYTPAMLDQFITVVAAATVIAYSLYTVSPETEALHGTPWLIATVPLVLYGLLRYLFLLHRRGGGGDPSRELLTDRHLMAAFLGWLALVVFLLA
ncbi:MAG: decaprenyl-phosphate phosphoribosyltransferase [Candidatus Nitricoxidivorans perseverans]|uniref:Decaprenyl-phosphate phosphoribosyltransferase n=1 Tax=Candidatus Nitricoxidivorans perseverans TaxID=2975601 RepID=A0AA49FKC7_9PROT|nr:MAG: decaprenyl-phosphate phosphoribosyltransferase [Candidatus Nitricoxidivorans perseverans]